MQPIPELSTRFHGLAVYPSPLLKQVGSYKLTPPALPSIPGSAAYCQDAGTFILRKLKVENNTNIIRIKKRRDNE
jgi:hypothetical protein